MLARPLAVLALALAVAATGAVTLEPGQAGARPFSSRVSFGSLPRRVLQGTTARVAVKVQAAARCGLAVRYSGGSRQPGLGVQATVGGQASWTWQVPLTAQAGPAKVTAACGKAGSVSRTMVVVGAKTVPHIEVVKSGYSVRVRAFGGSSVSWGLLLSNSSKTRDAVGVQLLVNMVDATDHVIGSASQRLSVVPGGAAAFPVGSALAFPGAAPVTRLEVVVQVDTWTKATGRTPAVDNVGIAESTYDRGWVGQVQGELVNDDEQLTLVRATLNAVVLDAGGNVIGGGQGYSFAALPSGTREAFTIKSGVDAIQFAKAATALISIQPSYQPAGT